MSAKESPKYVLNVRPINPAEPGSHRLRIRFMNLAARADENDLSAVGEIYQIMEARCYVPDDAAYTVEEALDNISANDFDALVKAIQGEPTVGEESAAS